MKSPGKILLSFPKMVVSSQKEGAHANGTKISHQERIFTRINMDELGFEVIRKVKIWLNLVAFGARAPYALT